MALIKLGHQVYYNRDVSHSVCNIVLEGFDNDSADHIVDAADDGADFITIVSEYVTGDTFNNNSERTHPHYFDSQDIYTNRGVWKARFDNCLRVMEVSRAIWCLAGDCQLQGYRDLTSEPNKVQLMPLDFLDTYETVQHGRDESKDIDFLFTGTLSRRRLDILNELRSRGANVVGFKNNTPAFIRDDVIGRSRICLNLLQTDDWKYASRVRFFYHLMNRSYILSEKYPVATSSIDKYIDTFDKDAFFGACLNILREGNYTRRAREKHDLFRDAGPEEPGFVKLLDLAASAVTNRR